MALYFRPFPTVSYRIPGTNRKIPVTDITRRFAVTSFISNLSVTFDEYFVQDGERPDTVAGAYYMDPTLDWLVLLSNEIQDPYFEWPMGEQQLQAYIIDKYGSLEYAYSTNHHYEWIIQKNQIVNDGQTQQILPEKTVEVDYQTYLTLIASDRRAVSIYDYEVAQNDKNRKIYLLDFNFAEAIREQHPYIFTEGGFVS